MARTEREKKGMPFNPVKNLFSNGKKAHENLPSGLPNVGNTCYINAVFQVLKRTPGFTKRLDTGCEKNGVEDNLFKALKANNSKEMIQILKSLGTSLGKENLARGTQEDSFEFFNWLLEGLETNEEIRNLFEGKFLISFTNEACRHIDVQLQSFTSLALPIMQSLDVTKGTSGGDIYESANEPAEERSNTRGDGDEILCEETDMCWKNNTIHQDKMDVKNHENCVEVRQLKGTNPLHDKNKLLDASANEEDFSSENLVKTDSTFSPYSEFFKRLKTPLISHQVESLELQTCLSQFTLTEQFSEELLPCRICVGERAASSDHGDARSFTEKGILIVDPPPILVLQLNRFHYVIRNGIVRLRKKTEVITYPRILDISPYSSRFGAVQGILDICYELYAVIAHHGNLKRGHYVAYVKDLHKNSSDDYPLKRHDIENILEKYKSDTELQKCFIKIDDEQARLRNFGHQAFRTKIPGSSPLETKWFRVSDDEVSECDQQPFGEENSLKDAYILFYQQVY